MPSGSVNMGRIGVADWRAKDQRHSQRRENTLTDIAHGRATGHGRFTLGEIAQHDAAHVFKFSRLLQVHQRAIDLPGFHAAILQNKNRILRVQFPRRSDGRFHKSQAPA